METIGTNAARDAFLSARQVLLAHRTDQATAARDFRWPKLDRFNWALDYFDAMARGNDAPALWIVDEDGSEQKRSFRQMAERSAQVANFLRRSGRAARRPHPADARQRGRAVGEHARRDQARRGGDPGHHAAHARRPARPPRARPRAPRHRRQRAYAASSPALPGDYTRICVGAGAAGLAAVRRVGAMQPAEFEPDGPTQRDRPAAAVLHLRHHRASRSSCCTRTRATRSATCRRCTGSACSRATCT